MNRHAGNFRELIVYQKARSAAKEIFMVSKRFPKDEQYSLTDQVRRSSRSVGAQIAEAWGKRRFEKHFISKLTDSDSEQYETQHWIETAVDCGYIAADEARDLTSKYQEIGRMLNGVMAKSASFCGQSSSAVREDAPEYFTA